MVPRPEGSSGTTAWSSGAIAVVELLDLAAPEGQAMPGHLHVWPGHSSSGQAVAWPWRRSSPSMTLEVHGLCSLGIVSIQMC